MRTFIFPGFTSSVKYNNFLKSIYENSSVVDLNKYTLFCSPAHHLMYSKLDSLKITNDDIVHCISGASFFVVPYIIKRNLTPHVILESPGLDISLKSLLVSYYPQTYKHFDDVNEKKYPITKYILENILSSHEYKSFFTYSLDKLAEEKRLTIFHSLDDTCTGRLEKYHDLIKNNGYLTTGKHGRLFNVEDNLKLLVAKKNMITKYK